MACMGAANLINRAATGGGQGASASGRMLLRCGPQLLTTRWATHPPPAFRSGGGAPDHVNRQSGRDAPTTAIQERRGDFRTTTALIPDRS